MKLSLSGIVVAIILSTSLSLLLIPHSSRLPTRSCTPSAPMPERCTDEAARLIVHRAAPLSAGLF